MSCVRRKNRDEHTERSKARPPPRPQTPNGRHLRLLSFVSETAGYCTNKNHTGWGNKGGAEGPRCARGSTAWRRGSGVRRLQSPPAPKQRRPRTGHTAPLGPRAPFTRIYEGEGCGHSPRTAQETYSWHTCVTADGRSPVFLQVNVQLPFTFSSELRPEQTCNYVAHVNHRQEGQTAPKTLERQPGFASDARRGHLPPPLSSLSP